MVWGAPHAPLAGMHMHACKGEARPHDRDHDEDADDDDDDDDIVEEGDEHCLSFCRPALLLMVMHACMPALHPPP